jgi:hypothetical protein
MNSDDDLNEELMRSIASRLGKRRFVSRVDPFPSEKPDRIVATFYESFYPNSVTESRIELRLRLNNDINVIYLEEWSGERWACRWDRHENDHNTREHFHPPPNITTQNAKDIELPRDPNRTVLLTMRFIEDRITDLWQTQEITYPNEYQFDYEYGTDIWV